MNEYGRLALAHWTRWLPSRLSLIADEERTTYFTDLGEQVQTRIEDLEQSLEEQANSDLASLDYLEKVARLNAIRAQAREMALHEMVFLDPETSTLDEDEDLDAPEHPLSEWMDSQGMPRDRTHPLWAMLEDDETSTQDFAAASLAWENSLWAALQEDQPRA